MVLFCWKENFRLEILKWKSEQLIRYNNYYIILFVKVLLFLILNRRYQSRAGNPVNTIA